MSSAQPASGTVPPTQPCGTHVLASPRNTANSLFSVGTLAPSDDAPGPATTSTPQPSEAMSDPKPKSSTVNIPSRTSSTQQAPAQPAISSAPNNTTAEAPTAARRGSKRSTLTRSRNNSRSSRRSAKATRAAESKEPIPPLPQNDGARSEKKSRSGFLAFLNCCSSSDTVEESKNEDAPVPAKKAKVPPTQAKAPRPTEVTETSTEKEADAKQLNEKQNSAEEEKATSTEPKIEAEEETNEKAIPVAGPVVATSPDAQRESQYSQDEHPDQLLVESKDVDMTDVPQTNKAPVPEGVVVVDEPVQPAELQPQILLPPPPPLSQRQEQLGTSFASMPEASPEKHWLLPPAQPPLKGRKCLILDLDETLVHSSFKILNQADFTIPVEIEGQYHNVYVIKRPGVDQFMKRVGELYEVVVFTASVSKYGDPLLDQLDIHHVVHHRLFRESCYNHQGNYVKVSTHRHTFEWCSDIF